MGFNSSRRSHFSASCVDHDWQRRAGAASGCADLMRSPPWTSRQAVSSAVRRMRRHESQANRWSVRRPLPAVRCRGWAHACGRESQFRRQTSRHVRRLPGGRRVGSGSWCNGLGIRCHLRLRVDVARRGELPRVGVRANFLRRCLCGRIEQEPCERARQDRRACGRARPRIRL